MRRKIRRMALKAILTFIGIVMLANAFVLMMISKDCSKNISTMDLPQKMILPDTRIVCICLGIPVWKKI